MRLEVTSFDMVSDELISETDVTSIGYTYACELLNIPWENLVYVQPLTSDQVSAISLRAGIDIPFNPSREYFLQPSSEYDGEKWPPAEPEQ